nr:ATP synthase delta/epsilon chain alpha-helix domain-containing protein [Desulfobacterales bacterium]
RAEKRLEDRSKEDIDFMRAKLALERALNRIKLAGGLP